MLVTEDPTCFRALSDGQLLEVVLRKDERAWRELLRRFRPLLFRCINKVAFRYGSFLAREDVDEIFSEVCFNLLRDDMRKLRAYDPLRGSKLSSWLGLIAINTAYDDLRARRRRPLLDKLDNAPERPTTEPDALDELLHKEQYRYLAELMAGCSAKDRRFIELYYGQGRLPEEVAEVMCISVKTVYSKKNKLRAKLEELARRAHFTPGRVKPAAGPRRRVLPMAA